MELQIPCSIRAKISTKSILCREAGSDPRDHKAIMPVEGGRNHRGRSMPGPHSSTTQHTTKDQRIRIYGVSKREEQLMIFQRFGNMKFAYRNREFWCRGYYVDTAGKNTAAIKAYIQNQLKTDKETDQLSLFDPRDPFTGSK